MPYRLSCTHAFAGAVTNFIKQTPHLILRQSQMLAFRSPAQKKQKRAVWPTAVTSFFRFKYLIVCSYYTRPTEKESSVIPTFSAKIFNVYTYFTLFPNLVISVRIAAHLSGSQRTAETFLMCRTSNMLPNQRSSHPSASPLRTVRSHQKAHRSSLRTPVASAIG